MTYGDIRLRLTQLAPGVQTELLDGWIQNVYTEILDRLPWKRQEASLVLQAPASITVGTVDVTQGSRSVTGTGTAFSAAMLGRVIRIANNEDFYQVSEVASATALTLDRPLESRDATLSTYRIDQSIFVMPERCRIIRAVAPFHDRLKPLELITPAEVDRISLDRNSYGAPKYVSNYWDSFSNPPRMQLELYPIPQSPNDQGKIPSWSVDYIFDASPLDAEGTSFSMLPWVRPGAIEEGVLAKIRRHQEKYEAAKEHRMECDRLIGQMAQINAAQRGPRDVRLARELQFRRGRMVENPFSKNFDQLVDDE